MSVSPDEVRAWLSKAQNDLMSAQTLIERKPAILDTACFHCQQTAEKALKAFLTFKEAEFEKTHDLTYLIAACASQYQAFNNLQEKAELLAPYAVEVRYPGDAIMPSADEADEAFAAAKALWDFVLTQLPPEYHLSSEQTE